MHRIEGDGFEVVGGKNMFTEGNPLIPIPATMVTADWANAVQEEIATVIEQAGATLETAATDTTRNQLYTAIRVPPAWTAMTLNSPWITLSHAASYRLESNTKRVWLKGVADGLISSGADWDFWNIPVGYRPPFEIYVPCVVAVGAVYKNGVIRVALGGTPHLELYTIEGASPVNGTNYTVSLDGVSWTID